MFDIDDIFKGMKPKKQKKKKDLFDIDRLFPKKSEKLNVSEDSPAKISHVSTKFPQCMKRFASNTPRIEVHNHFHGVNPNMMNRFPRSPKKYLSTFESVDNRGMPHNLLDDNDRDGYPAYMDPNDNDPNVPRPMTTQRNGKRVRKIMNDILGE